MALLLAVVAGDVLESVRIRTLTGVLLLAIDDRIVGGAIPLLSTGMVGSTYTSLFLVTPTIIRSSLALVVVQVAVVMRQLRQALDGSVDLPAWIVPVNVHS